MRSVVLVSPKEFIALHSNWIDLLPLYFSEKMHREWDWGTALDYGEYIPIYKLNVNFPTNAQKSNALTFRQFLLLLANK